MERSRSERRWRGEERGVGTGREIHMARAGDLGGVDGDVWCVWVDLLFCSTDYVLSQTGGYLREMERIVMMAEKDEKKQRNEKKQNVLTTVNRGCCVQRTVR